MFLFVFYFIHLEYAVCFQGSISVDEQCFRKNSKMLDSIGVGSSVVCSVPQIDS